MNVIVTCVIESSRSSWALESSDNASPVELKEQDSTAAHVDTISLKSTTSIDIHTYPSKAA